LPHVPQLALSVAVVTQALPQSVVPAGHVARQRPFEHACPVLQAVPHDPQFIGSDLVETQVFEHRVSPDEHVRVQLFATQL
jgi:hypothetical protein